MFRSASQPLTQTWALHRLVVPAGRRGDQTVPAGSQRGLLGAKMLAQHPTTLALPEQRLSAPGCASPSPVCVRSVVSDSVGPPWTAARQAPLSMGVSRQEYWSGLPCPPPGNLPDPEMEPAPLLHLLHWQAGPLPLAPPGSPAQAPSSRLHQDLWGCGQASEVFQSAR